MQLPPFSVIASWPTPNYVDPVTRGKSDTVIISVLLALVTVLLVIRIYTRVVISKGFGLDDVLILLAYLPASASAVIGILGTLRYGWDRHIWDLQPSLIVPNLQLALASEVLFDLATTLTKLSMLALTYRVVKVGQDYMQYVVKALAIVVAIDGILFFFITTFQCNPPSDYWTLSATPQHCINEQRHLLAASIINTVSDFLIVLVPIPTVRKLELPKKQRIVVYALFGGGIFATVAGAVRTFFTWQMVSDPLGDRTWHSYLVVLTAALELFIGIICASLPATKPFFAQLLPRLLGTGFTHRSTANRSRSDGRSIDPRTRGELRKSLIRLKLPSDNDTEANAGFWPAAVTPSNRSIMSMAKDEVASQIELPTPLIARQQPIRVIDYAAVRGPAGAQREIMSNSPLRQNPQGPLVRPGLQMGLSNASLTKLNLNKPLPRISTLSVATSHGTNMRSSFEVSPVSATDAVSPADHISMMGIPQLYEHQLQMLQKRQQQQQDAEAREREKREREKAVRAMERGGDAWDRVEKGDDGARKEEEEQRRTVASQMSSVYQMTPYEDGHISIHKARRSRNVL